MPACLRATCVADVMLILSIGSRRNARSTSLTTSWNNGWRATDFVTSYDALPMLSTACMTQLYATILVIPTLCY